MSDADETNASTDWRSDYRRATAHPPPGAKARVFRALSAPRASSRALVPAFLVAAAAGGVVVATLWPSTVTGPRHEEGLALIATKAKVSGEGRVLQLEAGRLAVSVWGAPLVIEAKGRRVEVEAAVAVIEVAGDQVQVTPFDGVVSLDGAHMSAPRPATRPDDVRALESLEAADAPLVRAEARAVAAVEAGAWSSAAEAWSVVAASTSLRAEVALVKRGELELRRLAVPARARDTFDEAARRFPKGALALERSLSALEAAATLKDWADVERRGREFETSFPTSERLEEVRRARATALHGLDQLAAACALADTLSAPLPFSESCRSSER
jgi:hypothetical protein